MIRLRRASIDDADALSALAARLFEQTFAAANTADDMAAYLREAFSPERQRAELASDDRVIGIAEDENGLAGYFSILYRSTIEPVIAHLPAEIERIYIDARLHGKGAGDLLMNACIDQARAWRADVLWLAVWEENPRAIAFYERRGFTRVGAKTFRLGSDVQRDLVMALPLSP